MPNPIRFVFDVATKGLDAGVERSERLVKRAADTAEKSGRRIDGAFESTAGHADNVASKGAQAAGAFSGLGSLAQAAGGPVASLGNSMLIAGVATQAAADAGDLLNVVTESTIGKKVAERAATIASAAASRGAAVATRGLAIAQRVLNLTMRANPILLAVTGLILLAGALVLAYKKSATFRAIVNGAFAAVRGVVAGALPTIRGVVDYIIAIPDRLGSLVGRFRSAGSSLIHGLIDGLRNVGGSIGDLGRSIVNSVIGFLNDVLPHSISINKGPIHVSVPLFPNIPMLASGGIVYGPTLALIGEAGPEAVVPLSKSRVGGNSYQITVEVPVAHDLYTVGETLVAAIREYEEGGGD